MKCSKCDAPAKARGLCKPHYRIWHKENKPLSPSRTLEATRAYARKYHAEHKDKELEYRQKNKETIAARGKRWRQDNQEHCVVYAKEYVRKHFDAHAAACKRWKRANPEKLKSYKAKSRAINPEKWRKWDRSWRLKNQDKRTAYEENRRAKKKALGGVLSVDIRARLMRLQAERCACCAARLKPGEIHLDHIMPLALNGAHADSNMQLLCALCNRQKHAKHPVDFMRARGFLL